jgi:hypothetical protein
MIKLLRLINISDFSVHIYNAFSHFYYLKMRMTQCLVPILKLAKRKAMRFRNRTRECALTLRFSEKKSAAEQNIFVAF